MAAFVELLLHAAVAGEGVEGEEAEVGEEVEEAEAEAEAGDERQRFFPSRKKSLRRRFFSSHKKSLQLHTKKLSLVFFCLRKKKKHFLCVLRNARRCSVARVFFLLTLLFSLASNGIRLPIERKASST